MSYAPTPFVNLYTPFAGNFLLTCPNLSTTSSSIFIIHFGLTLTVWKASWPHESQVHFMPVTGSSACEIVMFTSRRTKCKRQKLKEIVLKKKKKSIRPFCGVYMAELGGGGGGRGLFLCCSVAFQTENATQKQRSIETNWKSLRSQRTAVGGIQTTKSPTSTRLGGKKHTKKQTKNRTVCRIAARVSFHRRPRS